MSSAKELVHALKRTFSIASLPTGQMPLAQYDTLGQVVTEMDKELLMYRDALGNALTYGIADAVLAVPFSVMTSGNAVVEEFAKISRYYPKWFGMLSTFLAHLIGKNYAVIYLYQEGADPRSPLSERPIDEFEPYGKRDAYPTKMGKEILWHITRRQYTECITIEVHPSRIIIASFEVYGAQYEATGIFDILGEYLTILRGTTLASKDMLEAYLNPLLVLMSSRFGAEGGTALTNLVMDSIRHRTGMVYIPISKDDADLSTVQPPSLGQGPFLAIEWLVKQIEIYLGISFETLLKGDNSLAYVRFLKRFMRRLEPALYQLIEVIWTHNLEIPWDEHFYIEWDEKAMMTPLDRAAANEKESRHNDLQLLLKTPDELRAELFGLPPLPDGSGGQLMSVTRGGIDQMGHVPGGTQRKERASRGMNEDVPTS